MAGAEACNTAQAPVAAAAVQLDFAAQQEGGDPSLLTGRLPRPLAEVKQQAGGQEASPEEGLQLPSPLAAEVGTPGSCPGSPMSTEAQDEARNTDAARVISLLSMGASLMAAALGLGIGFGEETLSLVGFGLEAALDGVSSALVLWRFKRGKVRQHRDAQEAECFKAERGARRERHSGVGIGGTFVALAVLLLILGACKLLAWDPEEEQHAHLEHYGANYSVMLSLPSAVIFGVLAMAKFRLSRLLRSHVLEKDALCSVLGAVLALIVGVAGLIEEASGNPADMAIVDVAASTIIAIILLVEGLRTLRHNTKTDDASQATGTTSAEPSPTAKPCEA